MSPEILLAATAAGFAAGFLDSIVGGGGLIMTPAMLNLFPEFSILQVIATQRTSSIFGSSVAARNYLNSVRVQRGILVGGCAAAALLSTAGAALATRIDAGLLKTVVLVLCVLLAVYTFVRKDLGQSLKPQPAAEVGLRRAAAVGAVTGFYNGLIGPGTGVLMVFAFVGVLGLDFLRASAVSKLANVAADLSSWLVLMVAGFVVWSAVLPLIVGNMLGNHFGSRLAILKGSRFIRLVFLLVVSALIARLAFDFGQPGNQAPTAAARSRADSSGPR